MLKWVSLALLVLLALLQYHLWMGEGGIFELRNITARVDVMQQNDDQLRDRNDQLAAEVVDLKNGLDAIEERSRNDLGMVRNDEQFMWVPDIANTAQDAQPDDNEGDASSGQGAGSSSARRQ